MSKFNIALDSFIAGFVAYPIVKYVVIKFGDVLWQDVKKVAYTVWDKVKSKV